MSSNPRELKSKLLELVRELRDNPEEHIRNPDKDFIRNRKLPLEKVVFSLLGMEGNSLTNELLRQSGCSVDTVTSAAFVQQRAKLLPITCH